MAKARKAESDRSQQSRFIEAAREHGASEDERVFDANLKAIAKTKLERTPNKRIQK